MNNMIPEDDEALEDELAKELASWKWDGGSLTILLRRLAHLESRGIRTDWSLGEWSHTVPEQYRGVSYRTRSANPLNSLQQIDHCIEIVAVDSSGVALINQFTIDTYLGVDYDEIQTVMTLHDAQRVIDEVREIKRMQESGEVDTQENWGLVGWNESLAI